MSESDDAAREEIQRIFENYVFGFMRTDLEREIWLAAMAEEDQRGGRKHFGASNVMCALGLICYTEFLGSFITGRANKPMENFEAFLERMGECYRNVLAKDGHTLWSILRNGMVHEYAVKRYCKIVMLRDGDPCGLGRDDEGGYYFVVQHYFEDFMVAAENLYQDLQKTAVVPK